MTCLFAVLFAAAANVGGAEQLPRQPHRLEPGAPPPVPPSFEMQTTVDRLFAASTTNPLTGQIEAPLFEPYGSLDSVMSAQPHTGQTVMPSPGACATQGCGDQPVARFREGCLQCIQVQQGSLGGGSTDTLGIHHVAVSATGAVPLGSPDHVLLITPTFRADLLSAPAALDLPDHLYDTGIKFFWKKPLNESLSGILMVAPSIRSDFSTSQDAVRIFGIAMLSWEKLPDELTLSAGVVYLDRADLMALPAVGILWTPAPHWRIDLQFPQPRISYRVAKNGPCSESWAYLAGGFGGNTWAVTRTGGVADELTISELRLMAGFERIFAGNKGWFVEGGLAFARTFEYAGLNVENELDSAMFYRVGITF